MRLHPKDQGLLYEFKTYLDAGVLNEPGLQVARLLQRFEAVAEAATNAMVRIRADLKVKHHNCGCDFCALHQALRILGEGPK